MEKRSWIEVEETTLNNGDKKFTATRFYEVNIDRNEFSPPQNVSETTIKWLRRKHEISKALSDIGSHKINISLELKTIEEVKEYLYGLDVKSRVKRII